MSKIFGVVLRLQEPEITARCYGKECGRGIFAALFDDDLGALVACSQEECSYLEKQTDEPLWKDGEGRDVYLRLLTPLPANVELTGAAAGLSPQRPATEGSEVERRVGPLDGKCGFCGAVAHAGEEWGYTKDLAQQWVLSCPRCCSESGGAVREIAANGLPGASKW